MNTLTLLLALLGRTVVLSTPIGECEAIVVAPGQAMVTDGTCSLDQGAVYLDDRHDDDAFGPLTGAYTLPSGRVVFTFEAYE